MVRWPIAVLVAVAALALPAQGLGEPAVHGAFLARTAEGSFDTVDPSGCITTFASPRLIAFAGLFEDNEGDATIFDPHSAFADLTIIVLDTCQGTVLSVAYGEAMVPSSTFVFRGDGLMSAALNAPITVCGRDLETFDCIPGTTRAVLVDVVWRGVGEVGRFNQPAQRNMQPPIFIAVGHSSGAGRAAELTGAIVDDGMDYAAGVTGQGALGRTTTVSVSVLHV